MKENDDTAATVTDKVDLHSSDTEECASKTRFRDEGGAKLGKKIGLLNSISIIVGSVIGSGIFVTPQGILRQTHSFGASMIIWVSCGLFTFLGAYCYAELGTMIPKSGADYSYTFEAFGPFFGFLRLWLEVIVVRPVSAAVLSMVFADYILDPGFITCATFHTSAVRLLACICVLIVGFINSLSVRWSTRAQDFSTFTKVSALITIIVTGFVQIARGRTDALSAPFEDSNLDPGDLTVAFYNGWFAYTGWHYFNAMVEEMKNPRRDLVLAHLISCVFIIALYTLANLAYVTVLSIPEILEADTVAVVFAVKMYGHYWWIMPLFVAISTSGCVNGTVMTTSRMFFAASQQNQMPKILSFLHVTHLTPIPSVVFTCAVTILYIAIGDIGWLILYLGFVEWLVIGTSVLTVIIFRFTRPTVKRPVKVPIVFPFFFMIVSIFLIIFTFVGAPREALIAVSFIASGIPVYILGCIWTSKPKFFIRFVNNFTIACQKLLRLVPGV